MTLLEMKKKVLALIEEIVDNPENATIISLTNDPDIEAKLNYVINQIQYELSRIKKIPDYLEIEVKEGDILRFRNITEATQTEDNPDGYEVYQLDIVRGIEYDYKADGTIIKILTDGIAEIEYYRYPIRIKKETSDDYVFELSSDVLEVMPYGVAADVLKSDVSNSYGDIYARRYDEMKNALDIRYNTGSIEIEGGI